MARRKRKSDFEDVVQTLALMPWQMSLLLAPVAYFGFHLLSQLAPPPVTGVNQLGGAMPYLVARTAGMFLQYLAPFALLLASLLAWIAKRKRRKLLIETEGRRASAPLQQLSWKAFEQLVAAHFEREGYTVTPTQAGADGGVDVIARKGSETFLIQCKQWRATKVGVSVVRELFGLMAAQGATGAYVVSMGPFTREARHFAEGRNIELVDAHVLLKKSEHRAAPELPSLAPDSTPADPSCPKCGAVMVRRVARRGANAGTEFYGCSTYPKCRGTVQLG